MTLRVIEVIAHKDKADAIKAIAQQKGASQVWQSGEAIHMLVPMASQQAIVDALQGAFDQDQDWRILLLPVEAAIPDPEAEAEAENDESLKTKKAQQNQRATREEIYNKVARAGRIDSTFLIMTLLSTIVVAIGLIENNVAVVIGAMVIAPLLGPNLALSLGTALGDYPLMKESVQTNLAGLSLTLVIAVSIGWLFNIGPTSAEILSRTSVGYEGIVLAMASGAAAVLALTSGMSTTLVGVMVAVALLPPAATFGMMIGSGYWDQAAGAAMLLMVNISAVNIAGQVVFVIKGVRPRTWLEARAAKQSRRLTFAIWTILLLMLSALIYVKS